MLSAHDPTRRRQPVERPLDVVALELLVSVSQALLAGILLALATQLGGDARAYGLPVPGLLAILGVAVGVGWVRWLTGGSGWVMASVCLAVSILAGSLWLLSLQDPSLPRVDPLVGLIAVACAIYGLVAGVFLDGPHRAHWKGGLSRPRRGMPQTRVTPARFSPPVQKVVDERLTDLHLPQVSLPSAPRISVSGIRRPTSSATPGPTAPDEDRPIVAAEGGPAIVAEDGLAVAAEVVPQAPAPAEPAQEAQEARKAQAAQDPEATEVEPSTNLVTEGDPRPGGGPAGRPAPRDTEPPAAAASPSDATGTGETERSPEATPADPDAPTQPVVRPAVEWPRPIEPKGHTAAHRGDPPA